MVGGGEIGVLVVLAVIGFLIFLFRRVNPHE